MNEKLETSKQDWIDPDDAPELDADWFKTATPMIGNQAVSHHVFNQHTIKRGHPVGSTKSNPKQQATLRIDADTLSALKSTGKGWQTRINDILRQYVAEHSLPKT
jgi:uncharacterized protein (DUF4415 family)